MANFITLAAASAKYGLSQGHLTLLLRQGKLTGQKIHKQLWKIDEDSLLAWEPPPRGRPRREKTRRVPPILKSKKPLRIPQLSKKFAKRVR